MDFRQQQADDVPCALRLLTAHSEEIFCRGLRPKSAVSDSDIVSVVAQQWVESGRVQRLGLEGNGVVESGWEGQRGTW